MRFNSVGLVISTCSVALLLGCGRSPTEEASTGDEAIGDSSDAPTTDVRGAVEQ